MRDEVQRRRVLRLGGAAAAGAVAEGLDTELTIAIAEVRLGNIDAGVGLAAEVLRARPADLRSLLVRGRELLAELATHADERLVVEYRELLDSYSRPALPSA